MVFLGDPVEIEAIGVWDSPGDIIIKSCFALLQEFYLFIYIFIWPFYRTYISKAFLRGEGGQLPDPCLTSCPLAPRPLALARSFAFPPLFLIIYIIIFFFPINFFFFFFFPTQMRRSGHILPKRMLDRGWRHEGDGAKPARPDMYKKERVQFFWFVLVGWV